MAKNVEEAQVVVTMNGQAAINEMEKLEAQMDQYREAAAKAYVEGDKALGDKLTKKIETLQKEVKVTKKEMKDFGDAMKSLNSKSLSELTSMAKQLESQLKKLGPETAEFAEKSKQLQQVNTRVRSLKDGFRAVTVEVKESTLSLKGLSEGFNRYFGMITAGIAAVTGVSMAFRKTAEEAAKLDDTYSDVMKTTGLMHDEVEALDKQLMELDTRTSREQLLLLARDAGKLGIQGSENILGFVRAADQIQVALGEDLGEGAIRNLGKIADVFGYTKTKGIENSLLSIGSAINAVGQASTANEAYLVDFTQRLAGVGAQTGISAANIIGFASGLDQSAMKVEMAATAFQTFLTKLYEDPAKFAQYAGMQVKEFTDLLNNDANTAVITILKNLKDQDGFAALVSIFKDMGVDGARATSVLAAMASNLTAITDAQSLANVEFEKATSLADEFATKNNNMQASLDKAKKEFKNASITLGQSLNPALLKSTNVITYLIKALASYGKEIKAAVITIASLTLAIKLSTIAHTAYHAVTKGLAAIEATFTVAINATSYAFNIMRGRTIAATKAYLAMKAAMSTSVFGIVAAAVTALVVVVTRLVNKEKEAADAMKYMQSIEDKVTKGYAEEEAKLKTLHAIVKDNNVSLEQRKKALEELQSIVPEYHASLDKEGKLIEGNTNVLDNYIKKLREATRWQVYKDEWQDLETKLIEVQDKIEKAKQKAQEELIRNGGNSTEKVTMEVDTWGGGTKVQEYYTEYGKLMRTVRTYQAEEDDLLNKQDEIQTKMSQFSKDETVELTEMQKEIQAVVEKYEKLSREIKNDVSIAPAEGAKQLGELDRKMRKEIDEIRKKYQTSGNIVTTETTVSSEEVKKQVDKQIKSMADVRRAIREQIQEQMDIAEADRDKRDFSIYNKSDSDIKDPKANEEFWNEIYAKRDSIVAALEDNSMQKVYDIEMQWAEKLHEKELLTDEEYEKRKLQLKLDYASKAAQELLQISEQASNLVNALRSAETAKAEAEYQAQLSAAGDNAEKREQIEAQYEKDKLDIQKKYADADMAINIAKTTANGAVAAIKAYAEGGPYAGPILAAVIAATTAAEIATIIAQRNAIMNTSVSSKGSSTSVTSGGSDVGKREITGYSEGGYTGAGGKYEPAGIVHRGEWVAPKWMVKQNPVTFANLDQYRRHGSHGRSGSASRGFADGGYAEPILQGSIGNSAPLELSESSCRMLAAAIAERGITIVQLDKALSDKHAMENRFKTKTSR